MDLGVLRGVEGTVVVDAEGSSSVPGELTRSKESALEWMASRRRVGVAFRGLEGVLMGLRALRGSSLFNASETR